MNTAALLQPYSLPSWASSLKNVPKYKLSLGNLGTPIQRWFLPGVPEEFQVFIKRDDMTGCSLSGNKVRKLGFIFAEVVADGCKHVITTGAAQSNQAREAALVSAQLGIKCHLFIKSNHKKVSDLGFAGNPFFYRLAGADIHLIPESATAEEITAKMEQMAATIQASTGEKSKIIPRGSSDAVGVYGYVDGFKEMMSQGIQENFDDIAAPCGSAGTLEGLAIANYLTGSKLKVHGFMINYTKSHFHEHVTEMMKQMGMEEIPESGSLFDVSDRSLGEGYAKATPGMMDYIIEVARSTGVILDPTYNGKAVYGLVQELKDNPAMFKGKRILYVHTGGLFGAFDGRLEPFILAAEKNKNSRTRFTDVD